MNRVLCENLIIDMYFIQFSLLSFLWIIHLTRNIVEYKVTNNILGSVRNLQNNIKIKIKI